MVTTGFDSRVKIQQIIENQLPEFVISETPKAVEFLKQYYISQEFQGGPIDIAENLDQYKKLNNLNPDVISGVSTVSTQIGTSDTEIYVDNTKGFPPQYGLVKIDDEIITYTGITTNSFTGCVRGFSGITSYRSALNPEELEFSSTNAGTHSVGSVAQNLSALFLKEFYRKLKQSLAPGFEDLDFVENLDLNNFLKEIRTFYQTKGTSESFRILYNVLYGLDPTILNLKEFLVRSSDAEFIRREVLVAELISGSNPNNLVGQVINNNDNTASAPVSEVEIITRNNKTLYKIQLFAGYDEKSLIEGTFEITPKTKVVEKVLSTDTVITVDSTVGFDSSGTITVGSDTITYTDKSVNQFFGCSGITSTIDPGSDLRSDKIIYGYENGDTTKKVELRITGVLSELENQNDIYFRSVGDVISVKNIGKKIENPSNGKTYKELLFNSWIYNTSSRYEVESFTGNQVILHETPDKSSLKVGDSVNVLDRNSENIIIEDAIVTSITNRPDLALPRVVLLNKSITGINSNRKISIRRNIENASSVNVSLKYPKITANVQNTYEENSKYIHVASNSLPDYSVTKDIVSKTLSITASSNLNNIFSGTEIDTNGITKYTILSFSTAVPFITGDAVVYSGSSSEISGLTFGQTYYVEVLDPTNPGDIKNKIRLYNARSFIGSNNYVKFQSSSTVSDHVFTLEEQTGDKKLAPKKLLRKISLVQNIQSGTGEETKPGPTGMLINGVEIINYKSNDKIYYGPLSNVNIINSGSDYDVLSPPTVVVSNPTVGLGTTALVDLVVRGNLKEVIVDPNEVDVNRVVSASISGGNGSGAILEPYVEERFKEISFNAQTTTFGGGVNISDDVIAFLSFHNLQDGTPIVYNRNGNEPLGIGTFGASNTDQGRYLSNGSVYYPEIVNTSTIKLYNTISDLNSGINTIGFTTANAGGIHKFRLLDSKNILSSIQVVSGGSGYENRSLKIKPTGISTVFNSITFDNHGFKNGDLINYRTAVGFGYTYTESISGLTTSNQYYVLKLDDSRFRLANAGLSTSTPSKDEFNRGEYVKFSSIGSGQHIFEYPPITLNLEVEYAGTIGTITATPVFKGEIVDAYLYEPGTDYGSKILNFHRRPTLTVRSGQSAQLKPIVSDGKIVNVEVQNSGLYYSSSPDLVVNGDGVGAKLRAEVSGGRITRVIVINSGTNYNPRNTSIAVKPLGKNGSLLSDVRSLTINNKVRFSDEILLENGDDLSYGVVGYSTDREGSSFYEDGESQYEHSKIIGWAYDGNPVYGPYGYSDPKDRNSALKVLDTGYTTNLSNVYNRPSGFNLGFFVEDYVYTDNGDLDSYNGRFSKTPEFPNGVYAYYVGVSTNIQTNKLEPKFPYFIGNNYRSKFDTNLNQSQDLDFNSSNLVRNTFPYRVSQQYSNNDFIIEPNKLGKQTSVVEIVSEGSVESLSVLSGGSDYAVGEALTFDNGNTGGSGVSAVVGSIKGKGVVEISTTAEVYNNSLVLRKNPNQIEIKVDPYHDLLDGDVVEITGVSTTSIGKLSGSHKVGVTSVFSSLIFDVSSNATAGVVTDIYISPFPSNISIGSTLGIGTETLSVLNVFDDESILRVSRGVSAGHTASTQVDFYNNKFTIDLDNSYFNSRSNDKVYFNPSVSVSSGLDTGTFNSVQYQLGVNAETVSVETQSIYIPNHPFVTNQRVLFVKPSGSGALIVRNTPGSSFFNLPESGDSQYVYIINKTPDTIGIVTDVGLTTTTSGLFYSGTGSNSDYYYLEPQHTQITADVKKITSQVSVSTAHGLSYGDTIQLIVKPGLSTGIGTTASSVSVKYNSSFDRLLVNTVGFNSTGINTTNNKINIPLHGFTTGEKVFYDANDLVSSGLSTGGYFVYRINDDYIYLCDTYSDSIASPPRVVSIASTGGADQELSLINPQLTVTKNNDVVFDLSDTSLSGYDLKFFFDSEFKNEFVSIGNTSVFAVSGVGTIGVSSTASVTIGFNTSIPTNLYYNLEKSGSLVSVDADVHNKSNLIYRDSVYTGEHKIFGVGSTTFNISLKDIPEKYSYKSADCEVIKYNTTSKTATGGIEKLDLISGGIGYNRLPIVSGISTLSSGTNAVIKTNSTNIGRIEDLRIADEGFEFSSDKTLKPQADIPRLIRLQKSDKITQVSVVYGGKNYLSEPTLSLVNDNTRSKVSSGLLEANLRGSALLDVDIVEEPKGLESVKHTIFTENNSNGVSVERILSYTNGIVECELTTPAINGFVVPPFAEGDYVFVEGIQKQSTTDALGVVSSPGTGFNSPDNGYRFFRVVEYTNSNPAVLKYDIGEYTDNAGTAVSPPTTFTSIVNQKNYPTFSITRVPSIFYLGEKILANGSDTDLFVQTANKNYITVSGEYKLSYNDSISGFISGNLARVEEDIILDSSYTVNYSKERKYGWKNDTGKLNNSYQVLPDNDYYQNLSYSIKTTGERYKDNKIVSFDKSKDSVNRLVHPSGFKNFADVGITSSASVGIGSDQFLSQILDFVNEERVDTFNNFDLAIDYLPTTNSSDAIILRNKKLADFIQCISNRVLQIDDISNKFSSAEFNRDTFIDAFEYSVTDQFSKFLVQIVDEDKTNIQASEVVILNNYNNTYTLNKANLYTGEESLGTLSGTFADNGNSAMRFDPTDPLVFSYNLKIYRDYFSLSETNVGVGFTDIGFLRLTARTEDFPTVGVTTDIFKSQLSSIDTIYSNVFIRNEDTLDMNYFEILAYHDGNDGYISEYYFDTDSNISGSSFGFIGTFGVSVDGGVFKLNFTNNTNNEVTVKAKTVGFGSTASGIGTYRYLVTDQDAGTEKSARLESTFQSSTGITTINTYDLGVEGTLKSLVRVGVGTTVALHQFLVVSDNGRVNIQQYPFLSVGSASTSGIGTFGADVDGSQVKVKFYPDSDFSSDTVLLQKFDQFIYFESDEFNTPDDFTYGVGIEELTTAFYGALNNFGKDRLEFDLNYGGTPIFEKTFNPNNASVLNQSTGVFSIPNHFFQTGEELIYTPYSTLSGVTASAVGIGSTLVGGRNFKGDFITGFSTITGVASTTGINIGDTIIGPSVSAGTTVISIGSTFTYFVGNVVSGGSSVITGIANTSILTVGSGIFSGNNSGIGTIVSIGINSITSTEVVDEGTGTTFYSEQVKTSVEVSQVSTGTTIRANFITGISTDIAPTTVYAIRVDNDSFKLTGVSGGNGIGFTFTSSGSGNYHKLEMKKKLEKSLITVNGVNQYPIIWTPINHTLDYNGGAIGAAVTFLGLSGIASVAPRDLIKVDDEYLRVVNVGFGTTNTGPVTGLGTVPIVEVNRGFVGSSATTHTDGTEARIYRGAYNIVGNKIHFTEAPDGKGNNDRLDQGGLPLPKSTFNGRVFLRRDYEFNKLYDDISDQFTGIGRTFNLTIEGESTSGVEPGSGLVFINDVFQTPDTENNAGNNYELESDSNAGLTTVTFTSVTRPNTDDVIVVDYDVNQNQVPRGGIIISLGSTGGLGYAPLVGAKVIARTGAGGSITEIVGIATTGSSYSISTSSYNNTTGIIEITTSTDHGLTGSGNRVFLEGLEFSCPGGSGITSTIFPYPGSSPYGFVFPVTGIVSATTFKAQVGTSTITHTYVGQGTAYHYYGDLTFGSGYYGGTIGVGISDSTGSGATITAAVGAGGSLSFTIKGGGSGYTNPSIRIDDPSYENLTISGVSRLSVGNTTDAGIGLSMTVNVGQSSVVGVGTSLFEVKTTTITKPGYAFRRGDKFRLVGLVTDARLSEPTEELIFTVEDVFTDSFASWQLGELDYIDSIKSLQNGSRTRFPLFRNNELLSFEKDRTNPESDLIDFNAVLLIFLNGVMQEPNVSYVFEGGTTFRFKEAPKAEDNIAIFFYRGTRNVDSFTVNVNETVKPGDTLELVKNNFIPSTVSQTGRTVSLIQSADVVETGIYLGDGIDEDNFRPIHWSKQKRDLIVKEDYQFKSRDSLEPFVIPATRVIKDVSLTDEEIFVDSAQLFKYEENDPNTSTVIQQFEGFLVESDTNPVSAGFSASVSGFSTISSIGILTGGSGYTAGSTITLKIGGPIGVGSTATATATVSAAGTVSSVSITNPGSGYTYTNPPAVIAASIPSFNRELIPEIRFVEGFSGIITGITTSAGSGSNPLALNLQVLYDSNSDIDSLLQGYYIYVSDTNIGSGVTSINTSDSDVVGIGTTFADNVYVINQISRDNLVGVLTCNILSTTNITGLETSADFVGRFSWGRLFGIERSTSPISVGVSGYTVNSGLTTFPQILRRGYGLRNTGGLSKELG